MNTLLFYSPKKLDSFIDKRDKEVKFGEAVVTIQELNQLKTTAAKYVLVGIPEDIGIQANFGNPGAKHAWDACLKALLNIQANSYTSPENLIILGEIDCITEQKEAERLDKQDPHYYQKLGKLVSLIDQKVAIVVEHLVTAGKTPILIGGGHNNSYGNIKGTSFALQKPISAINFDVHADFRPLEHRHSGNGFSYAFNEGFLKHYYIFGLQKNYTSQRLFDDLLQNKEYISYCFFETVALQKSSVFEQALHQAESFIYAREKFGLELDLDSIENIPSSAKTPSGFSVKEARTFIQYFSKNNNVAYLHLCEAAPKPNTDEVKQVGKLLAYLIIDFIS